MIGTQFLESSSWVDLVSSLELIPGESYTFSNNGMSTVLLSESIDMGSGYIKLNSNQTNMPLTIGDTLFAKIYVPGQSGSVSVSEFVGSSGGAGNTDLSAQFFADYVTISSSTGTGADIVAATTSLAGIMTATDKSNLDQAFTLSVPIVAVVAPTAADYDYPIGTKWINTSTVPADIYMITDNTVDNAVWLDLANINPEDLGSMAFQDSTAVDITGGTILIDGKSLSTNDFTTIEKDKLTALPDNTALQTSLDSKLEVANIVAGTGITLDTLGNDITINSDNVVNLGSITTPTNVIITNDSGTGTNVDGASANNAGVMGADDFIKLSELPDAYGLQSDLNKKLEVANIIAGTNITLNNVGNDITINVNDVSAENVVSTSNVLVETTDPAGTITLSAPAGVITPAGSLPLDNGVLSQVLKSDGAGGILWANDSGTVVTPLGNMWYVAKNGNDATGDGSIANPFLTIQKAVDVSSNEDAVIIANGNYSTENIIVNKSVDLVSEAESGVRIGTLTFDGTISSHISKLHITGDIVTANNSGGWRLYNCRYDGNITIDGAISSNIVIDSCYGSNPAANISISVSNFNPVQIVGGNHSPSLTIFNDSNIVTLYNVGSIGAINHGGGLLGLNNVSTINGDLFSAASNAAPANQIIMIGCSLIGLDNTPHLLNKTGNCPIVFGVNNILSPIGNTITGSISYVHSGKFLNADYTPSHYSPANTSVSGNIEGIDVSLGTKLEESNITAGDNITLYVDNGVITINALPNAPVNIIEGTATVVGVNNDFVKISGDTLMDMSLIADGGKVMLYNMSEISLTISLDGTRNFINTAINVQPTIQMISGQSLTLIKDVSGEVFYIA